MHKFQLKEQFLLNQPLKEFQKISPSKLFFRPKIATNETHTGRSTFCQSLLSSDLNLSKKLVLLKQIFDRYQSEDIVEQLSKAIVQLLSDSGPPIELLVKKDYIELLLEFISVGYKEHIISSSA